MNQINEFDLDFKNRNIYILVTTNRLQYIKGWIKMDGLENILQSRAGRRAVTIMVPAVIAVASVLPFRYNATATDYDVSLTSTPTAEATINPTATASPEITYTPEATHSHKRHTATPEATAAPEATPAPTSTRVSQTSSIGPIFVSAPYTGTGPADVQSDINDLARNLAKGMAIGGSVLFLAGPMGAAAMYGLKRNK